METALRASIINLLQIVASPNRQLRYEQTVPVANIPAELLCMWFDDLYHPDTELFASSFSESEMRQLARFNRLFATCVEHLPESGGVRALWESADWQKIQMIARKTLANMGIEEDIL